MSAPRAPRRFLLTSATTTTTAAVATAVAAICTSHTSNHKALCARKTSARGAPVVARSPENGAGQKFANWTRIVVDRRRPHLAIEAAIAPARNLRIGLWRASRDKRHCRTRTAHARTSNIARSIIFEENVGTSEINMNDATSTVTHTHTYTHTHTHTHAHMRAPGSRSTHQTRHTAQ